MYFCGPFGACCNKWQKKRHKCIYIVYIVYICAVHKQISQRLVTVPTGQKNTTTVCENILWVCSAVKKLHCLSFCVKCRADVALRSLYNVIAVPWGWGSMQSLSVSSCPLTRVRGSDPLSVVLGLLRQPAIMLMWRCVESTGDVKSWASGHWGHRQVTAMTPFALQ